MSGSSDEEAFHSAEEREERIQRDPTGTEDLSRGLEEAKLSGSEGGAADESPETVAESVEAREEAGESLTEEEIAVQLGKHCESVLYC